MSTADCTVTAAAPHPDSPVVVRHVLADHAGLGGVTVTVAADDHGAPSTPLGQMALADHMLAEAGARRLPDGVTAWREGGLIWMRLAPGHDRVVLEQRHDARELVRLPPVADPGTGRFVWAWTDRRAGAVAARGFLDTGTEDVSIAVRGGMALARRVQRSLLVRLADGSVMFARPAPGRLIELGGRVSRPGGRPSAR